jgi:hypothetical protein
MENDQQVIDVKTDTTIESTEAVYALAVKTYSLSINVEKDTNIVKNPYNRSNMPTELIDDVNRLYRISCIIYKSNKTVVKCDTVRNEIVNIRRTRRRSLTNDFYPTPAMEIYQERVRKLTEIREKSIQNRVSELFTEMDFLGNYTCEEWFYEIRSAENYLRLYRTLFNIWYHRSQMPLDVRQKICMCGDPFENVVAVVMGSPPLSPANRPNMGFSLSIAGLPNIAFISPTRL